MLLYFYFSGGYLEKIEGILASRGMIVGGIDLLMLLSDWYLARQEKRIQTAKAEGKAEGIAEGKAEGIAEGKAEVYQEIVAWHTRRMAAEARGETFTEPPPGVPQNGTE